jgi:hypothetical protein
MNCPDHETLSAFFDGEAPDAGGHVATCGECRAFLDDLTAIREAVIAARPALGRAVEVPQRGARRRLPILAFALLLLVLLAIPAMLLLHPRNRDDGVFSKYDSGGRAVIYLRGRE